MRTLTAALLGLALVASAGAQVPLSHEVSCPAGGEVALDRWPAPRWSPGGDPRVQVVYLVPSDRTEHPLYQQSLDRSIRHLQQWMSEQMPAGETFALAEPAVLTLRSPRPEAWFREHDAHNGYATFYDNAIDESLRLMGEPPGINPERAWLIYVDADATCGQCGGCGFGYATGGGFAVVSANDLRGFLSGPWMRGCEGDVVTFGFRPCRFVGGIGHELGHALGLPHPPGCDDGAPTCDRETIMYTGFYGYPAADLTDGEQATLGTHPFLTPQSFPGPLEDCDAFVPLDAAHLLEPHDGRPLGPGGWLVWGDDEVHAHTVEVATDPAFTTVVTAVTTGDEWHRFEDPAAAATYFWRVRRTGAAAWSEVRSFTVTPPPVAAEGGPRGPLQVERVRPNPARREAAVRFSLATASEVALAVYDALGRRVEARPARPYAAGGHAVGLDVAAWRPGVYVVRLEAAGTVLSERVTVAR